MFLRAYLNPSELGDRGNGLLHHPSPAPKKLKNAARHYITLRAHFLEGSDSPHSHFLRFLASSAPGCIEHLAMYTHLDASQAEIRLLSVVPCRKYAAKVLYRITIAHISIHRLIRVEVKIGRAE